MNCPLCNGDTRVLRTDSPERQRECVRCGHRFESIEIERSKHDIEQRIIEDAKALAELIQKAA